MISQGFSAGIIDFLYQNKLHCVLCASVITVTLKLVTAEKISILITVLGIVFCIVNEGADCHWGYDFTFVIKIAQQPPKCIQIN